MAVVQISKIQQRRGQKLLSGMPQLSSAELAWAVDTQELFIGNGSVTEGAPYVGNTRVLTEHDNILELAGSYKFAEPDLSITASIFRSLQSKLDEIQVSVIDFGPQPDPSTNHTPHFVTAFTQLFQNADTGYRKVLIVPNGHYYLTSTLRIPSNVILRGETQDGVILDIGANAIEFLSAAGTDVLGPFTSTDRPENVSISNLTIQYTTGSMDITGLKDSKFENVKWKSTYTLGDTVSTIVLASQSYDLSAIANTGNILIVSSVLPGFLPQTFNPSGTVATVEELVARLMGVGTFTFYFTATRTAESLIITANTESGLSAADIETYFNITVTPTSTAPSSFEVDPVPTQASTGINNTNSALSWVNSNFGTRTTGIDFVDCQFDSVALALKCIHLHGESDVFDTELTFDNCTFFVCDTGVYVEGVVDRQGHLWTFRDCKFEEIAKQAFFSTFGTGTLIKDSEFKNVGNGVNGAAYPETEMVKFSTKFGNVVENCRSDRQQSAGITLVDTKAGVPEVVNAGNVSFNNNYYSTIYLSDTFAPLAVFSCQQRFIIIDYNLTLGQEYNRKGVLTLSINDDVQQIDAHVAIADNFTYSTSLVSDLGGNMITNFEFNAELKDNTNTLMDSSLSVDTILLTYKNPLQFSGPGSISYSIRYGM